MTRPFKKKPSRSRSPVAWHDKSHSRSFSGQVVGTDKFAIVEEHAASQAHKLSRSMKRVEKKIKKLTLKKHDVKTKDSEKQEIERQIVKLDGIYSWKATRLMLLQRKDHVQTKRIQSRYANERGREAQRQENIQKVKVRERKDLDTSFHPVERKQSDEAKRLNRRQIIKSPRGGAKIVSKRYKRFSNK